MSEKVFDPDNITEDDEFIGEKLAQVVASMAAMLRMDPEELWFSAFDGKSITLIDYPGGTEVLFAPADEDGTVHYTYRFDPDYVPEGGDDGYSDDYWDEYDDE